MGGLGIELGALVVGAVVYLVVVNIKETVENYSDLHADVAMTWPMTRGNLATSVTTTATLITSTTTSTVMTLTLITMTITLTTMTMTLTTMTLTTMSSTMTVPQHYDDPLCWHI